MDYKVARSGKQWIVRTIEGDMDASEEFDTSDEAQMMCDVMNSGEFDS